MQSSAQGATARPLLRLFNEEAAAVEPHCGDGKLSPQMRLRAFFEAWFVPIAMRKASTSHVQLFLDSLDWWERLTEDPPLIGIGERTLADFAGRLEAATYRRGRLGSERRLSAKTIENHLTRIDRIITRAGPKLGKNRPGARLLDDPPAVIIERADLDTLPPFTWQQVQDIFAAIPTRSRPATLTVAAVDFWSALLSAFLYTGWRRLTVFSLDWSMLEMPETDPWWIEAPPEIVPKTRKRSRRVVHPVLREALLAIRPREPVGLIFEHGYHKRTLHDWHAALQRKAGITRPLGWNAWRRTHDMLMQTAGYDAAVELGRAALDHSDVRTTTTHYYDAVNDFIPRLPAVALPRGERQRRLFD